jgi:2-methylcitrate dehydratase PrpD
VSTLAEQLAAFAAGLRYEDVPAPVLERVRLHALDLIGVCLLGAPMEFARILRSVASMSGGNAESTLIGAGANGGALRLPAPLAALYNGGLAHGNEFDDTYAPGRWHGSAGVVPPALAIAEQRHADGKAFLVALAAGLEVGCRLSRAAPGLLTRGFHSTGTVGVFGGALAAGKLLGLGREQLAHALGIAGGFASGTAEFLSDPEPWSKRIQIGNAAQGAITAARAAAAGFQGPRTIFEGRHGYFRAYAGEGNFDLARITEALGTDWQLRFLYPKRYACDHIAQGYVDCAIAIAKEAASQPGFSVAAIESVECAVHPLAAAVMFEPRALRYEPANGWSARWSMPFNLAVALSDRALPPDAWTDVRAVDPATRALMAKVSYALDSSMAFPGDYPARLRVRMQDGRVLERDLPKVAGSIENPMPAAEYERKFSDNARHAMDERRARELIERMRDLAGVRDMTDVAKLYS